MKTLITHWGNKQFQHGIITLLILLGSVFFQQPAHADITVTVSGPGGSRSQTLPDSGGPFDFKDNLPLTRNALPLNRNAVNTITVTATDSFGQKVSHELKVTQLSLDQIVVSQVTAERMSVEQIKQLVSDGVIKLDNPANYNVSKFDIVLTIGQRQVPISVAVPSPIAEEVTGWEVYKMPDADNGGSTPPPAPTEIIVFDEPVSGPGLPQISIPGVIIIEGNIKSLKEFYTVRLLLMNTSGIFTLKNVISNISFPDAGLTSIAPSDGIISFGDILPGDGGLPGQAERQFIIRGDEIGIRQVKVGFGGSVAGPGIPEESPVPFNGAAFTKVEVKGPPTFRVRATHPDSVEKDVPYEFKVEITNTGDIAALYSSLDLSVGADAKLVSCDTTTPPTCTELGGTETRTFGDILPGQTVSALFMIKPEKSGPITSCLGVSDQNITLQVLVGTIGCLVGQFPPEVGVPDGTPTVSVVPTPNTQGVGIASAVAAFFSQEMDPATITTGSGGTFNVFDRANTIVPGTIRLEPVNGKTVAVWQVLDGITNLLVPNVEYTVMLTTGIANKDGIRIYNAWTSRFTTTGAALNDFTPPILTLAVDPPVNPSYVLPGQLVKIDAYAADQGSGVVRVELRIKDLSETGSSYQLVDRKLVFTGDLPPYIFTVDSAKLVAGHTYQLMGTAYDYMMNAQNATINLVIAATAAAPTITLPPSPAVAIPQGISVSITPESITGGVNEVRYYLDGATTPFKSVNIPPYQAGLGTVTLILGNHTIRAVALDALGQSGEATYTFTLAANPNKPQISLNGTADGATYIVGSSFVVSGTATDPLGIASVTYSLDGTLVATGNQPFAISTTALALGSHTITAEAVNAIGGSSTLASSFVIAPLPNGPPPTAPIITALSLPANGNVTLSGNSLAGARIDITNSTQKFGITVNADGSGTYSAFLPAVSGDLIQVVAYDYKTSQQPSQPATATVPAAPVLTGIATSPATMNFAAANAWQDITVTGSYDNSSNANLTAQATYSSNSPSVASVNSAGRVVALKSGAATITAAYGGMTAQVAVSVDIVTLTAITADPITIDFTTIGQTRQLVVTAHYSNNTIQTLTSGVSFVSGNISVASVSLSGLVSAAASGATEVTVYYPGVQPLSVPVNVNGADDTVPQVLILSPASGSTVQRGDMVSVAVRATDAVGGVSRVLFAATGADGQIIATETRSISPASQDVATSFSFIVPDSLVIGSNVAVTAGAGDTGNQSASPATINLTIGDTTAPVVSITAPTTQTPYNYGDTITLTVHATDRIGVGSIRYATSGAFTVTGVKTLTPASANADATFTVTVPFGTAGSELRINAYASDASGNEGAAAPLDLIITTADITPPATTVTAVAHPGSSPATTVTYVVTEGLSDLDHVELYFRRNGIGTFNRYTDADNGNPEGKYLPQSGNSGTMTFNSTKMGGDGSFEFYTIGVDKAGNRELSPLVADQTTTFNAGTEWTVIASPATAGEGDTFYDNRNIRLSGTAFTVNGHHHFNNVELLNGAVLKHSTTTDTTEYRLDLDLWTLSIDSASRLDLTGSGYRGGRASVWYDAALTIGYATGSTGGAGGSYGGLGSVYDGGRVPNPVYGADLTNPLELGSGGGSWGYTAGGAGGGLLILKAINMMNDGAILSNGALNRGEAAGSGSGGALNIQTTTLSGTGVLQANGGGANIGVGGGGGRISLRYTDIATLDQSLLLADGGQGQYGSRSANGTVFLRQSGQTSGELVFTGQAGSSAWTTISIPAGYSFDNVTLRNSARVVADSHLQVSGLFLVTGNSVITHPEGNEAGLSITARDIQVDEGSSIDVTGRGYRGGRQGVWYDPAVTLGGIPGSQAGSGGSYGGKGAGYETRDSSLVYGNPYTPELLGSGGGGWSYTGGGAGAGRLILNASRSLLVNGTIRADGAYSNGEAAGGGSGGSILIRTSRLAGDGSISASGGGHSSAGAGGLGVSGGGGRVAIYCDYLDYLHSLGNLYNVTAFAGSDYYDTRKASAGTVYVKFSHGREELFIDGGSTTGSAPGATPLTPIADGLTGPVTGDTLTLDGQMPTYPNALVGLRINPDISQSETFIITGNTGVVVTVATPNDHGVQFATIAGAGKPYRGVYRFGNLSFRRGGNLLTGDQLEVPGTVSISENGLLSHYPSTDSFTSGLYLNVGDLLVESGSRIDLTGRGYRGGRQGVWYDSAKTFGNQTGAQGGTGGSHGGLGGSYDGRPASALYDDISQPVDLGSGGGGWSYTGGGAGGGRLLLNASNVILDGEVIVNGGNSNGEAAGDGSGGTVNISAVTMRGAGNILANGGDLNISRLAVGGGGGRVAIKYSTDFDFPIGNISVIGTKPNYGSRGGNGTILVKSSQQSYGNLYIDGRNNAVGADTTFIPVGLIFDNMIVSNRATVTIDGGIRINNTLHLTGNSTMTHTAGNEAGLSILGPTDLRIDAGSSIDVSGRGYRGGRSGVWYDGALTLGGIAGSQSGSGGSFGGKGAGYQGRDSSLIYGDPRYPTHLGSGGGGWDYYSGGTGGGRIYLDVGKLTLEGTIKADGFYGIDGAAGGGSGGSILVQAWEIGGSGTISANGGGHTSSGVAGYGTSGGGGRIALYFDTLSPDSSFNNYRNFTAFAGRDYYDSTPSNSIQSSAGTVYVKPSAGEEELIIDAGLAGITAARETPLAHIGSGITAAVVDNLLTLDGNVALLPNGLAGIRLNPDSNQQQTFEVIGNTVNIITVATPNENGTDFAAVAGIGKIYGGRHDFTNLTLRRGASLIIGDSMNVPGSFNLTENSLLSHYSATDSFISGLYLNIGSMLMDGTSAIDVSGRGYRGGRNGVWYDSARTFGNTPGSSAGAGGSHGGLGGHYLGNVPGPVYDSEIDPVDLGSGGGGYNYTAGGAGGGKLLLNAVDLNLDGAIRANGGNSGGSAAGAGSGGTVNITTGSLTGQGSISAAGGVGSSGGFSEGVGGGGGRIALKYGGTLSLSPANLAVPGGLANYGSGNPGTVYLEQR
ncbi:MAG TPA: hypothetical protein HPP97_01945 [Desulfuromonadales bacterium]|nr:hypothetical protein [Desulfuromonadales bacterium]